MYVEKVNLFRIEIKHFPKSRDSGETEIWHVKFILFY